MNSEFPILVQIKRFVFSTARLIPFVQNKIDQEVHIRRPQTLCSF